MGWSEIVVPEWTKLAGCLERKCTWIIPLATFGVAKTTLVIQFQRVRFVNNTDLMVIELSSTTPEVIYGSNFSVEQRWEVSKISENKSSVNVSSGVFWSSEPWGSGMVKGTIDTKSAEETKKSAAHFVALIEQSLNKKSVSGKGKDSAGTKRHHKKGDLKNEKSQAGNLGPVVTVNDSKIQQATEVQVSGIEGGGGRGGNEGGGVDTPSLFSRLQPILFQFGKLGQKFLGSTFLQGVCMLALLVFVYTMFARVAVLEKQLEFPQDSVYSKVFLYPLCPPPLTRAT
eukprot:TRINITY_DN6792_c0_g1_i2.p1 TRINITY_DN6792_c0_g1~~TRINITY_DN6792_c0_g1_i2.p1  ORF type:complete len:285 (+),score=59.81 TRINITY_DN6792_c0_g1_i2:296-1150(+)